MQNCWVLWNRCLRWSGGGTVWCHQCQSRSVRYTVTRPQSGGSHLHCSPLVHSLKFHLAGGGEKNGNTLVFPPRTRCPKSLLSQCPHSEAIIIFVCLFPSIVSCTSQALSWDSKPQCLKGSRFVIWLWGSVSLAHKLRASASWQCHMGVNEAVSPAPSTSMPGAQWRFKLRCLKGSCFTFSSNGAVLFPILLIQAHGWWVQAEIFVLAMPIYLLPTALKGRHCFHCLWTEPLS